MKERHPSSPVDEQPLLEHFREHQRDEPSAALDARILAAASRPQAARPGLIARLRAWLQAWLAGAAVPLRWSLALGSVALLGLGLSLSLRSVEPLYERSLPAAPVAAPVAQNNAKGEAARLSERGIEVMADAAEMAQQAEAPEVAAASPARAKGGAAPPPEALRAALRQIQALRDSGQQQQAAERLRGLQQRYPQLDLEQRLQQLREQDEAAVAD